MGSFPKAICYEGETDTTENGTLVSFVRIMNFNHYTIQSEFVEDAQALCLSEYRS